MALIELDLTDQPDPALSSPPPAHRYRIPGLLVAAVLVLVAGGGAPAMPTLWRYLGVVPAAPDPELRFQLTGGRAYTMTATGTAREVTSWTLTEPPRQVWRTRYELPAEDPDAVGYGGTDARQTGDVLLVSDGPATTVLDAHSGVTRWSAPMPVVPMTGGRLGLVQEPRFRPGTVYDQDSGEPGTLYFTAGGEPHVEPPTRTDIRAVDLYTGVTVWTVSVAGSVIADAAPGDGPAVLLLSSAGMQRLDGRTGKVVRRIALPRLDGRAPQSGELIGDVMMIYYYNPHGYVTDEVAYAPDTLARRWTRPVPEVLVQRAVCAGLLCSESQAALDVLDPATGRPSWRAPAGVDLTRHGGYVLETGSKSGEPVRLVDAATGQTRVDLSGWPSDVAGAAEEPIVLRRGLDGGSSAFGVVDAGRDEVQPLGVTGGVVSDCTSDSRHVLCRTENGLRAWAYRL
ncbi:hypothetical protein Ade02nite_05350 [Paractinoplanes deccanensis]|uniref:Pyrroloquinoline-quinone binding quinoprotein n=1 Tax=Paractinoplanes deccanensis TaxID=113561 RepID=A0ABQ3XVY5_9ACTN|nr:PQQ-binding-like beta-propeller repeat protein [Actinoplanes deccanensis]GID71894.1 hypothetical protein Ade02nite_05350 [Actinoplanes deccanensis]